MEVVSMSKLTCKGFLKRYLQELSLQNTSAVTKLVKEVDDNLRLLEPLSLYCVLTLTDEQIQRLNSQIVSKQIEYLKQFDNIENALSNKKLTRDYQKVYHSFECENKKQEVDNTIKALIVNRTQELKKENAFLITKFTLLWD